MLLFGNVTIELIIYDYFEILFYNNLEFEILWNVSPSNEKKDR